MNNFQREENSGRCCIGLNSSILLHSAILCLCFMQCHMYKYKYVHNTYAYDAHYNIRQ